MKKNVTNDSATISPPAEAENNVPKNDNVVESQTPVASDTTGNVPKPNDFKSQLANIVSKLKSFGLGKLTIIAVAVIIVIGGIVLTISSSSPKAIFKNVINKTYKEISRAIDETDKLVETYDFRENALVIKADAQIDTNISEIEEELGISLKGITVGATAGLDYKNEIVEGSAYIKGKSETIEAKAQIFEDVALISSTVLDDTLKIELDDEIDFDELKDNVKELEDQIELDPEKYNKLVKIMKQGLIQSLNSEYMEKEKDEIDVLDKSIKATKYSYIIDEDAAQDFVKSLTEYLLEDDKFADALKDVSNLKKSEIKQVLKELKNSAKEIEFEDEVVINIYTRGVFNKFAGISIEYDNKEYFSLFTDGNNYETIIDNHIDSEYSGFKLVVTSEKDKKEHNIVVKYNGEKIAKGTIKEFTDEVIDFDYEVTIEEETVKGEMYFSLKQEKKKISGEYKFKVEYDDEYIEVSGNYDIETKDKLEKMSSKNAVDIDEIDEDELLEKILEKVEKDETLNSVVEAVEKQVEKKKIEDLHLDSFKMSYVYYSSDLKEILAEDKAIIYSGTRYPMSGTPAYEMFNNLVDLLNELDYYSYYVNEYDMTSSIFQNVIGEVEYTCTLDNKDEQPSTEENEVLITEPNESACANYPVIYLVKDGKIVKALRGTITKDSLKEALAEIGIK